MRAFFIRSSSLALSSTLALAGVLIAEDAAAVITEPDGLAIPQALTEDLLGGASCCGATEANMSLQSLFNYLGDVQVNWQASASLEPQVFSPLCGFSGMLLLRGGGCMVDFGWYNVDPANPLVIPREDEIYPLVHKEDYALWGANSAFWPRVPVGGPPCTDPPRCTAAADPALDREQRWAPVQGESLEQIRTDPRFRGGLIGFAVRANPSSVCTVTKYSQHDLNQKCSLPQCQGRSWISAIMYKSNVIPNAFYVGFEDLPTSPELFKYPVPAESGNGSYSNDGDFNDFVYLVQGVTCQGGGQPCAAGMEGACGFGRTECLPDGTVTCVPQVQPTPEVCDAIDNDCNGKIDDNATCPSGYVCRQGVCTSGCSTGEFPCSAGLVCEDNYCVDPKCVGVECEPRKVCIAGQCYGGCEGVICPVGQVCQLGRCADPCANHPCPAGKVCEAGICVESCACRACPNGYRCDFASGACVVAGCEGKSCPAGQVCIGGQCVGACDGVTCPGGAACEIVGDPPAPQCAPPKPGHTPPPGAPDTTGLMTVPVIPGLSTDVTSNTPTTNTPPGANLSSGDDEEGLLGCNCRTAGGRESNRTGWALLLLGLVPLLRRRWRS